jgi:hypothetical protein
VQARLKGNCSFRAAGHFLASAGARILEDRQLGSSITRDIVARRNGSSTQLREKTRAILLDRDRQAATVRRAPTVAFRTN